MSTAKAAKRKSERPALQQRSQESRALLIKAGFKAFARDGYDGARVADIAKEAQVTVGAFYHRFGDKRGFFDVMMAEFIKQGMENTDRFYAQANPAWTIDELFERLVAGMAKAVHRNVGFFHAYFTLGREDSSIAKTIQSLDLHGGQKLYQFLEANGIAAANGITQEMAHFGINSIGKTLAFSAAIEGTFYRADDPHVITELAHMLRRYLHIDAQTQSVKPTENLND